MNIYYTWEKGEDELTCGITYLHEYQFNDAKFRMSMEMEQNGWKLKEEYKGQSNE